MYRNVLFAIALAAAAGPAAAGKLYKWVDDRGVTHYADRPPAHQGFEEIEVKEPKVPAAATEKGTDQAQAEEPAQERISAEEAKRRNCESSRSVLAQLEANENVRMDTNGDGVLEQLSPAQRREQIALYRKRVAEYCGS